MWELIYEPATVVHYCFYLFIYFLILINLLLYIMIPSISSHYLTLKKIYTSL